MTNGSKPHGKAPKKSPKRSKKVAPAKPGRPGLADAVRARTAGG